MKGNPRGPIELPFLGSWKEIANYLGKAVRTVQRYEHNFGLPVRRAENKGRGGIIASKVEIDAWVKAILPLREVYRPPRGARDSNLSVVLDLKANVRKMQKLCEEMNARRDEVRIAHDELRDIVQSLQEAVCENPAATTSQENEAGRLFCGARSSFWASPITP